MQLGQLVGLGFTAGFRGISMPAREVKMDTSSEIHNNVFGGYKKNPDLGRQDLCNTLKVRRARRKAQPSN